MYEIVLALHFLGLFMGGAPAIGLIVIGAISEAAPPEHRPTLARAVKPLKIFGKTGIGILLITGVYMATVNGIWSAGSLWFWIKIVAVAAVIAGIVTADRLGAQAMAGDAEAGRKVQTVALVNIGAIVVVLLAASFAFN